MSTDLFRALVVTVVFPLCGCSTMHYVDPVTHATFDYYRFATDDKFDSLTLKFPDGRELELHAVNSEQSKGIESIVQGAVQGAIKGAKMGAP